ncbi:hypothetical protein ACFWHT_01445 [Microbacterium sp. NPDC058342]|uniref:hypothetical protein n=1 Tax=Microbacterium sp. NPDC058342 TaxID=3346454 RepID=UPI00365142E2
MHHSLTRRVVAVGATAIAVVSLSACTAGSSDDPNETVKIRFAQFGNSTDDAAGMKSDPIKKAIEEKLNIELKYDTGTDGFDDRMLTELAVGTGPDLFPTWGETEKITKWIKDGAVLDLGEVVSADPDRYPTLTKMFASDEWKAYNKLYAGDEDKTYAIYSIASMPQPSFNGVPVYNTSILDEVNGGRIPSTTDEFEAFTKAAAEAGYQGWWPRNDKLTNWAEIDATMGIPQGTSIAPPTGNAWTGMVPDGDDTWKLMTVSDKSKDVVTQLASMYAADALSKGVGVKGDFDDAYADFGIGKIGAANFGFGYAGQFRDFYKSAWQKANPDTAEPGDLTLGTAMEGAKAYSTFSWMGAQYFVPASTKNPQRVLDLVEYLASADGQNLLFKGIEGETYTPGSDGTPEYVEGAWDAVNKAYGVSDGRGKYVWFSYLFSATEFMTEFSEKDWYESVTNPVDYSELWMSDEDKALTASAQETIDGYADDVIEKLPPYYNLVVLDEKAEAIRTKLKEISNRYLAGMIGGQMDIDATWEQYRQEFEAAGAADYEQMVNDAIAAAEKL